MEELVIYTCPKIKCERHGKCEECRQHHNPKPPRCERTTKRK